MLVCCRSALVGGDEPTAATPTVRVEVADRLRAPDTVAALVVALLPSCRACRSSCTSRRWSGRTRSRTGSPFALRFVAVVLVVVLAAPPWEVARAVSLSDAFALVGEGTGAKRTLGGPRRCQSEDGGGRPFHALPPVDPPRQRLPDAPDYRHRSLRSVVPPLAATLLRPGRRTPRDIGVVCDLAT